MIYAWAAERVEDRGKFDAMLTAPMPGRVSTSPAMSTAETNSLRAMTAWARTVGG